MNSWVVFSRSSDSRWLTDCQIWSKPTLGHNSVLDWDIDFKFCVLVQRAGGIYVSVLSVCPSIRLSVRLSVCNVFSPAITNEPLERLSWNYSVVLSTSKWTAELFFRGRLIQDGRLTAKYGRNLPWAITQYWIEILTSNFVCLHLKIKTYEFWSRSSESRWPTDRHIWSKPIFGHNWVLDWDIDFKFCVLVPKIVLY